MQPLLNRYRMAFTTSRRATVIGAPHPVEPGISGAINAHCSSVRSLGYAVRFGTGMDSLRFESASHTFADLGRLHQPASRAPS